MKERRRSALKHTLMPPNWPVIKILSETTRTVAQLLESAVEKALLLEQERDFKNGAWVLRRCFDDVRKEPGSSTLVVVVTKDDMTMKVAPSPSESRQ